ncbi:MAG: hypothetical protein RLZZ136_1192 [Pseudomonadota bacterium]
MAFAARVSGPPIAPSILYKVPIVLSFRAVLLPAVLAASMTPALAQSAPQGFAVSGSVRLRYETIDGQGRAGFNAGDELVNLRSIALLTYTHDAVKLVTEVYDSRAWGGTMRSALTTGEVNTFEPVQAYVQADLGGSLGKGTKAVVQAGRFTVNFGSRRLVASDDYRNTTNSFTGLRGDMTAPGGISATAIYVLPQTRLPDDGAALRDNATALDKESFAAVLWGGLIAHRAKGSPVLSEISFLHFGERDAPGRPSRDRSLNNLGLRINADPRPGQFDWGAEAIYQWGQTSLTASSTTALVPVRATFLRLQAGYSWAAPWTPHVLVELDRASGAGTGHTYSRFDPLFGMRRADLGPAGLYNAIGRTNIASPGVRLELTPSKQNDLFVGYRLLWLANSHDAFSTTGVKDGSGTSGSFAGQQIDMRYRHWLIPAKVRFEADATYLARGRFLHQAPNGRAQDVRYVSFNVTGFY